MADTIRVQPTDSAVPSGTPMRAATRVSCPITTTAIATWFCQVPISPTFYDQLLYAKIPKAQNDTDYLTESFMPLGSLHVKAAHKHVGEIDPRTCQPR
jgi:hypothetical protein